MLRAGIGSRIRPLAQRRLDEALRLAIGARGVGSSEAMVDAKITASLGEELTAVAATIVGEYFADLDAKSSVIGYGRSQEHGDAVTLLIGQWLGISHSRGVVDRHVYELPACPAVGVAAFTGKAMADTGDTAQFFHVQMQELTWLGALVALYRHRGF